jgi:hypothetical protein
VSEGDDTKALLAEIRDLLRQQVRLTEEIKATNDAAAARAAEHMAKAEAIAHSQIAQNKIALGAIGDPRWFKWGFWAFLALLLLVFLVPSFWR